MRSRILGLGAALITVATLIIVVVIAGSGDETAVAPAPTSRAEPIDWPDLGPAWPEEGWTPVLIDMSALPHEPGLVLDHSGAGSGRDREIWEARAAGEVLEHHYPQARLFSASAQVSAGVRVVYFEDEDQFFLQEDHMAGHYDPFIGPFYGDPREILADFGS